jgi:hypothetical protein
MDDKIVADEGRQRPGALAIKGTAAFRQSGIRGIPQTIDRGYNLSELRSDSLQDKSQARPRMERILADNPMNEHIGTTQAGYIEQNRLVKPPSATNRCRQCCSIIGGRRDHFKPSQTLQLAY